MVEHFDAPYNSAYIEEIIMRSIIPDINYSKLSFRPLHSGDYDAYVAVRQRIKELGDARYHSASYRRDKKLMEEGRLAEWLNPDNDHCVMGTFYNGQLIGIMTVVPHMPTDKPQKNAENRMAEWDSVWIEPSFRKHGVAKMAYAKLKDWTINHGYVSVESFVRADNHRMLKICNDRGSVRTHVAQNEVWADGSVGDAIFFVTHLNSTPKAVSNLQKKILVGLDRAFRPNRGSPALSLAGRSEQLKVG